MYAVSIAIPIVVGGIAAAFTPLDFWFGMKEGLIAFLGFLAASVIQVMVVTANFLQSEKLNPGEVKRLANALTRQQHFWIGLLVATVLALIFVIIGSALKDVAKPEFYFKGTEHQFEMRWDAVVVFFMASSFSFVFYRMFALLSGVLSLHNLRIELVMAAAQREADEKVQIMVESAQPVRRFVPDNYGEILDPPNI